MKTMLVAVSALVIACVVAGCANTGSVERDGGDWPLDPPTSLYDEYDT